MAQLSKRSLRERRAPKNFDSDNQDLDPWGYAKPSYSKELRNPSLQLNFDAKLLVKFLSSINRNYREHETEHRKKQAESIKEPVPLRERKAKTIQAESDAQKRQDEQPKEAKLDLPKKVKEGYNFKAQTGSSDPQSYPKAQSFLNKCKALNNESANKMISIQSSISRNKQSPADLTRFKTEKMQLTPKQTDSGNSFKMMQAQIGLKTDLKPDTRPTKSLFFDANSEKARRVEEIEKNLHIPKPTINENKIFKRSAYHVAIAYHIYLKKIREKGVIGNEIDPTYYARKLKEGLNK